MISRAKRSFIKSLQVKKYRQAEQCFLVQGAKAVRETLASDYQTLTLLGSREFLHTLKPSRSTEVIEATERELTELGSVESNNTAIAVVKMKKPAPNHVPVDDFALLLEDIRDPGNLGTMIRTADWYGIRNIVASPGTADHYNPKVINASMGSFLRVNITYSSLPEFIRSSRATVFGTFLNGEDVHSVSFGKSGLIVIGNESHGISAETERLVTRRITIPKVGGAESLNASVAMAIVLDNLRRS